MARAFFSALAAALLLAASAPAAVAAPAQQASRSAPPASWTEAFPWERVPTMAWTNYWGPWERKNMTGTGRLDDEVVRFLAENNELIVASGHGEGEGRTCAETHLKDFADRVASFNPKVKVIVYHANNIHHGALLPTNAWWKKHHGNATGLQNLGVETVFRPRKRMSSFFRLKWGDR